MAVTILNRGQLPLEIAYKDVSNTFSLPIYLPINTPLLDTEAANKKYVDEKVISAATGLTVKDACRLATTQNIGTYNSTGGEKARGQIISASDIVDGITLVSGNRILVKNNSIPSGNGIYVVSFLGTGTNGVWDRASDFDSDAEVSANAFCFIEEGSTLADTAFVLTTNNPIVIGGASGTNLTFTQFAGNGIGLTSLSVSTSNGFSGLSSGGTTPIITISTSLGAGVVKSNGAGAFVLGNIDLSSGDVINTLPVIRGGTGSNGFTGLSYGNGTSAMTAATGAQITAAIGSSSVLNSTNAVSFSGALSGDVTGNQNSTSILSTIVTSKLITGFVSSAGTVVATDSILSAINKLNGNIANKQNTISSSNLKVGVPIAGTANASNLIFTLPNTPIILTESIFVNGVCQQRGAGNDYQISGQTVTFENGNAPDIGAILISSYFI
jgi:hypothetical protein